MKVKIREVVDIESEIDLTKLSPLQKILVALRREYRDTKYYRNKMEREMEKDYRQRTAKEERLKEIILTQVHEELIRNTEMSKRGLTCAAIQFAVARHFEDTLREIVKHKEFISFDIRFIPCNKDLLRSFNKIPVLIEVRLKMVGGDSIEKINVGDSRTGELVG
jgi:hypothetical protein